ncbi:MAG: hypothetical protein IIB88_06055, partial [Chloroflexi bacterium]|nr:hypothetical protein [Chloroflexota bacterium]
MIALFILTSGTVTLPDTGASGVTANEVAGSAVHEAGDGHGVVVDIGAREVYVDGVHIVPPLARKQFDVLILLYQTTRPGVQQRR